MDSEKIYDGDLVLKPIWANQTSGLGPKTIQIFFNNEFKVIKG